MIWKSASRRENAVRRRRAAGPLGVIGLGKVGSLVADAAIRLGMNVHGYDPHITVEAAWSLPSQVKRAASIEELVRASHFVTLHVPLGDKTRHLVNAHARQFRRRGAAQLLARGRGETGGCKGLSTGGSSGT